MTLFAVTRTRGPAWDPGVPMRSQAGWDAHAEFMDGLAARGVIVLGGPMGEAVDEEFLLIFDAGSEEEVEATLARDPWTGTGMLSAGEVKRWMILLGHAPA